MPTKTAHSIAASREIHLFFAKSITAARSLRARYRSIAAFVSLAYNIGASAFCKSTVVKRFKSGDYYGACAAIEMWNQAGGKVWPGLVVRRADERAMCERGIPAMLKMRETISAGAVYD